MLCTGLCATTLFPCFSEGAAEAASRELGRGRLDRRRDFSGAVAAVGATSLDGWCCSNVKVKVKVTTMSTLWVFVLVQFP